MSGRRPAAILIGAMSEVSHRAIALMITTKKPIVEKRRRPVNATSTGRAKRLTRTRIAAHDRKPMMPAPGQSDDRDRGLPERERLSDREDPEQQGDEQEDECVEDDLDDETAHVNPLDDPD